jgi:hypothetical protein
MPRIRSTGCVIVVVLVVTTIIDPYGWYWMVSYDVGLVVWWKPAILGIDVLLLTLLGISIYMSRWRLAVRIGVLECGFAASAGLFIAHMDLIRNAIRSSWIPALPLLLGLYIATLVLRFALVYRLYRAVNRAADTPSLAAK